MPSIVSPWLKSIWRRRKLALVSGLAFLGLCLWSLLPLPQLQNQLAIVPCPLRTLTGIPCPGCGMTRSLLALARGDFSTSWHLHPFAPLLVLLIVLALLFPNYRLGPRGTRAIWVLLSILLGLWLWRLALGTCP